MPPKKLSYQEKLANAWTRICGNIKRRRRRDLLIHECWIGRDGNGLVEKEQGTFNVSFGKDKRLAHRVVYEYTHGTIDANLDVSHLCHDDRCLNPDHLIQETHADNHARIGCPGWINPRGTNTLICACVHTPYCKKVTTVDNKTVTHDNTFDVSMLQ